jgi:hypothetical protein
VRPTCIGLESANAPSTRSGTVSIIGYVFTGGLYLLTIVLFPGAAVAQEEVTCPGIPGKVVILKNQPYALCALATSFIYNEITYAKCDRLQGDSISLPQRFPFPPPPGITPGNISTMNQGQPTLGGYIVSTISPPAGATSSNGNLAVYTCEGGSYSQCDGGLCFTSTSPSGSQRKNSPLWGNVSNSQIICSCPVQSTSIPFEVMGPKPCPTTAAGYDAVCGDNVSKGNNGGLTYIGTPVGFELAAACLVGHPVTFNRCTRPEH